MEQVQAYFAQVQSFYCEAIAMLTKASEDVYLLAAAGVIALFFGLAASCIAAAIFLPILATIVYLAAEHFLPLIDGKDLPAFVFDHAFWVKAVSMYVVFLVAGGVVFGIKKAILAIVKK